MTSRSRRWAIAAGLVALVGAGDAFGGPSIWDAARDPEAGRVASVVRDAEELIGTAVSSDRDHTDVIAEDYRTELESLELQAAGLDAPLLHLALGRVWAPETFGVEIPSNYRKVADHLERVVEHAPNAPVAAEAWYDLAIAYAKLAEREIDAEDVALLRAREQRAYDHALELASDPNVRGNIYYNRGDAENENGEFDAAIADYRRGIALVIGATAQSLIYWSLGLALERSGDLPAALDAITTAQSIYPAQQALTALDDPNAFFVPPYEKFYLEALGELACARDAPSARLVRQSYENAQAYLSMYLVAATRDSHRGVPNAKLELKMIERKLQQIDAAPPQPQKKLGSGAPIRNGCPRPEVEVPPPPPLQLPFTIPPPTP